MFMWMIFILFCWSRYEVQHLACRSKKYSLLVATIHISLSPNTGGKKYVLWFVSRYEM
jgi:hypothetical protein